MNLEWYPYKINQSIKTNKNGEKIEFKIINPIYIGANDDNIATYRIPIDSNLFNTFLEAYIVTEYLEETYIYNCHIQISEFQSSQTRVGNASLMFEYLLDVLKILQEEYKQHNIILKIKYICGELVPGKNTSYNGLNKFYSTIAKQQI